MRVANCGALAGIALLLQPTVAVAQGCHDPSAPPHEYVQSRPLTLEQAVARAGNAAPEVLAAALEARAMAAEADQARRWINPVASIETENFAGTGTLDGFNAFETTLALEQTFQLGDKRRLSERVARARSALAVADCEVQRLEAQKLAGELFLELQAAIDMAEIADASANLAEDFAGVVARRVETGDAAPPELARAMAEAAVLRATADSTRGQASARALALASVWGSPAVDFIPPDPNRPERLIGVSGSGTALSTHPTLQAAEASQTASAAATERAVAGAWPDLTVSAGVRRFEDTGDTALVASIRLPLPLFDRSQDTARAARLRRQQAELSTQAIEARLRAKQASLIEQARAARSRLLRLDEQALPLAEDAYASAAEGYRAGKFNLTATLDARRSLIETRAAVIEARLTLETLLLRLRALTGATPFSGDAP